MTADRALPAFRLFVVGENTPDPAKWSAWSEWALVIAENEEQARELSDRPNEPACEIPLDKPLYLVGMTEPNWGNDL